MLAGVVVKIVVRIESIVAIETPGFAVELRCAALEGHGNVGAGGDAVIRRIVASQHLELAERVLRRHDGHLAAGTAVIILAAVHDPDVVSLAESVEADGVVGVDGERILHVRQVAADAEAKGSQADHVATVGGQVCDLLLVDQRADHVGVGLHRQGVRLDRNGL